MEQTTFEPQPIRSKKNPIKLFAMAGALFLATAVVVGAIVFSGMQSTDSRSKAAITGVCEGQMEVAAAVCGEKCITHEDCSSGLRCLAWGVAPDTRCRNAANPSSTTCAGATASPNASSTPTKPPVAGLPTAPPGCVYKQVQCIQAPCDPILECSSPTATPVVTKPHLVKFVLHTYSSGQNMAIDYIKDGATIIDDKSSLLTYTGSWYKGSDSSPYGGQYAATNVNGSAMSYRTSSKTIIVRPYRYSTRGGLDVYVDGVLKRQINGLNSGSGWTDIAITVTQ